ncbi:MAG: PAS domain-containing protein [bacterium]|nr:PAS domain-containing protein [bacterium]
MRKLAKWLGRVLLMRLLLWALVVASAAFIVVTLARLSDDYAAAGSLRGLWHAEWRNGEALRRVFGGGVFQFLFLVVGWSAWFRLRLRELGQLRLRRSEQKYRNIINHAGEAIFLLDADGRVLEWNKKSEDLFHQPRRNVLGRRLQDVAPQLQLDVGQIFADVVKAHRSLAFEVTLPLEGAVPRLLTMIFSAVLPGSGPLADREATFVVIARDITSEKQFESRLSETEKLVGIGQLAAGIAHQLNTPLGAILLSAQMLEDAARTEDEQDDIRRIIRQTEQCRGIIKGLLNFARPTGTERGRLDLAGIVRGTVYLMEKNLKVAGIEVSVEARTEPWVYGNRNELEQVVFNLLVNAMDAMEPFGQGGRIDIVVADGGAGEAAADPVRHRPRHSGGHAREHLPALLHDQGLRQGDGPGIVDRGAHRARARRAHRAARACRTRRRVRRVAAARARRRRARGAHRGRRRRGGRHRCPFPDGPG